VRVSVVLVARQCFNPAHRYRHRVKPRRYAEDRKELSWANRQGGQRMKHVYQVTTRAKGAVTSFAAWHKFYSIAYLSWRRFMYSASEDRMAAQILEASSLLAACDASASSAAVA
jgi:hypothetical protein